MVLRVLILFTILFSASSFAQRSGKIYFKKAQIQFKKKRYNNSLKLLRKGYNFKRPKRIPASALFLIAYNYQKLGRYSESNYYYNQLIKNVYLKKHKRVVRAYKKGEVDDVEIPRTLGTAYFNLGKNHYAIFKRRGKSQSALKAKMYIKICDEVDLADDCSDILEQINKDIKQAKLKRKGYEFYLMAGRLLFQDRVEIQENSSGVTSSLTSNNSALCYGAGLRRGSKLKGYDFSGCVFSGTTTVAGVAASDSGTDNDYKQSGVPIAGMLMEAGYYYNLDEQQTRLGISIPVMYRAGSYSEPTGYTITDSEAFRFGLSLNAGIQLPIIELQTKLAHMGNANMLQLNALYNF